MTHNTYASHNASNKTVLYSLLRNAGAMKHRGTPRGGASNDERDLLDEYLSDTTVDDTIPTPELSE